MTKVLLELREDALIDFFKQELKKMSFVSKSELPDIEQRLSVIADRGVKRHRKMEATKWLWKFMLENSLRSITNNLRGYNELCRYFDDFVEYENLLFALDKNHRDHAIHSIWVMLLGLYLRQNYTPFKRMSYNDVVVNLCEDEKLGKKITKSVIDILREHETALWCIIALTHDLGYPIEKTKIANEVMARMVSNFGFLERTDFAYNFTVIHQTAIAEMLSMISSVVACLGDKSYKVASLSGARVDYARSFEKLDHGIMSAYLMQMYLDFICESMGIVQGLPEYAIGDEQTASKAAIVTTLLRTIASHTNKYVYWDQLDHIALLLCLSDELEEFSRYSRSLTNDEWVNVGCRTEFRCQSKSVEIRYTFDNSEIGDDINSFFRGKVDKIWNRFELKTKGIEKVSITCKDVRKSPPVILEYKNLVAPVPIESVRRIDGNSSDNIQGFLDGIVQL